MSKSSIYLPYTFTVNYTRSFKRERFNLVAACKISETRTRPRLVAKWSFDGQNVLLCGSRQRWLYYFYRIVRICEPAFSPKFPGLCYFRHMGHPKCFNIKRLFKFLPYPQWAWQESQPCCCWMEGCPEWEDLQWWRKSSCPWPRRLKVLETLQSIRTICNVQYIYISILKNK